MGKRAQLLKIWLDIRASYWFLPSLLVICGLLLAGVTDWLDHNVGYFPLELPDTLLDTQSEGARSTLAVIAQSIIGVTGVMFSMTIVAVSFASGNFGPRLIGNFMRDRGNQWSLGILISTFVYAIFVLRSVQDGVDGGAEQFVPQYSLIVALLLTLVCVFTMIYFVHHVPETINVSRISANLGAKLEDQVRQLIDAQEDAFEPELLPERPPDHTIAAGSSGYIQTCYVSRLEELAEENAWHIQMLPAVGDFVTEVTDVFRLWADAPLDDDALSDLADCFAIGSERTENQNPAFLANQLVEMAARALSPGVNDPYTAMDCLNRMHAALTVASAYKGGLSPHQRDRVKIPKLDFDALFAETFPLCREYVKPDDLTRRHAVSLLETLEQSVREEDGAVIRREVSRLSDDT
ncbi:MULTISPECIES: DUF2254 domain-containing protein [unclassified Roseovarius]|uniref:DUF2254 domain-containing protein n=1 Tax=unclassified Roseovarius TaxID=2614913 RepID=UPI00273FA81B|nr:MULTISPECIES: DUF2254 domain-containing protein [unclassified Roseovarius]